VRWDDVVAAIIDEMEGDVDVAVFLAGNPITRASEMEFTKNRIEYTVLTNFEGENWETLLLQIDLMCTRNRTDQLLAAERAIRRLLHRDLPVTYGDVAMFTQLQAARDIPGAGDRVVGRSLDFRLEVTRSRYHRSTT
jgi:superfamily I DNA/RNA helicase